MSARPFTTLDTGPSGAWTLRAAGGGPVGVSVRHLIDLTHFFVTDDSRWPDALTSETRRHLSGCFFMIETALIMRSRETPVGRLAAALETPVIWPAIQYHPPILSPEVMAHMRLRAAVSLLGKQSVRNDGDPGGETVQGTSALIGDTDPALAEAAIALALAESRWTTVGAQVADLPAEHYAELVWTSAAILGTALYRAGLADHGAAMQVMTEAAFVLLAHHDEAQGGFGLSIRLARMLRDRDRHTEFLGQALGERRYLLFAALASEVIQVEMEAVLDVLVHGDDDQLAALCRTLGGAAGDYRHLLLDLTVVRGERNDPALVRLAQAYDALTEAEAIARTDALRRPAALRAKLAMIPHGDTP